MSSCGVKIIGTPVPRIQVAKEDDFEQWYQEILDKGDMVDQDPISKCLILKPAAYSIWERVKAWMNCQLEAIGVQSYYIPPVALDIETEATAGTTGNKPSKESVIQACCKAWIKRYQDLPFGLNHWGMGCRMGQDSSYFSGATAFCGRKDLLSVPVVNGLKSKRTSRPNHLRTSILVVLGYIPGINQCVEGATCHELGQGLSKKYDIAVEDRSTATMPPLHVWQNTCCLSARAIGLMIAVHGDNRGLIIPPRVAKTQVLLVAERLRSVEERQNLHAQDESLVARLSSVGVRAVTDNRDGVSPAWKYNEWIISGVPLFLEVGPSQTAGQSVVVTRRDLRGTPDARSQMAISELSSRIPALVDTIQKDMYDKAHRHFQSRTLANHYIVCLAPHCLNECCGKDIENAIQADGQSLSTHIGCLCIPFQAQGEGIDTNTTKCINPNCDHRAEKWAMFGCKYS
ncbi:hypothetical protein BDV37DRAFT_268822 [Aspergillus pseudonomiae]|uniref:proline--tRNA ligase n=1 Tax=Aspergillus pseudonomiae TaxID=1506151 RepID=A0A5N7DPX6_9EURO|nr:uncharacterized protein BDV37DRAFT_268822 [Aspergillus pseudonomiae]KAE8408079.1 hypothetical protein BDV37DRAFT_268822 [Aspergillus pseudonomiae]